MGNLDIRDIKVSEAQNMDWSGYDITYKRDGTLIFYKDKKLFSPRCERSDRYRKILTILNEANFPECYGELYIDNGTVFDISRRENWENAKLMIIDLDPRYGSYHERQAKLSQLVKNLKNEFVTPLVRFSDFKTGWDYVLKTKGEGLVIRNEHKWFKVKILHEVKIEIKEHVPSKEKGTFILIDNNHVSGTSIGFVQKFHEIKLQGLTPMAEIEFPFITETGSYFQPRLRRVFVKGEENGD